MKVTTLRFGPDLWALLEDEASRVGVSVSQYVREAALARAAAATALRGEPPLERLAAMVPVPGEPGTGEVRPESGHDALERTWRRAKEGRSDAAAFAAESKQARRQAQNVSERSKKGITHVRSARIPPRRSD